MKRTVVAIIGIVIIVLFVGAIVATWHGKSSNNASNRDSATTQSPATSTPTPSQTAAAAGKVTIANMMFSPSQITVHKGDVVTWTNNDSVAHTVTDDLGNVGGPASGSIEPGSTYSFTFTKAGSFQYHCSIHPSMRGTIVVQ